MARKQASLDEFIKTHQLTDSLLVGYYGGGNFGDELLLEILLNRLHDHQPSARLMIYYLHPEWFAQFHKNYNHEVVNARSIGSIGAFLKSKTIVVGGGGLWGLDFNIKVFFLSFMLFVGRFLLRKRVYLLGVGFYNSTNFFGRIGGWLASKAAHEIYARDEESFGNFMKYSKQTVLSEDFSALLPLLKARDYRLEVESIQRKLPVNSKTLFIGVRNFRGERNQAFQNTIRRVVAANQDKPMILAILEPRQINPGGFAFINGLVTDSVLASDFHFNPVAFYFYMQAAHKNLIMIAPHYHALVLALMSHIIFMPIVYDNKSAQLLREFGIAGTYKLEELTAGNVQLLITTAWEP